jgi:ribonucrease Y
MIMALMLVVVGLCTIVTGIAIMVWGKRKFHKARLLSLEAQQKYEEAKKEIETERREASLKLKDELYKKRSEFELEIKRERVELERFQTKLNVKYEGIEKKEQRLDEVQKELQQRERSLSRLADQLRANEHKLKQLYDDLITKLEHVASMTREEARQTLSTTLEAEVRHTQEKWIQKVEEETRHSAKERSIEILVTAMQRYAAEQVTPHSSSIVHLPNEEMKGRVIGKEGRNIKALEMATGMEFVIGDTPEVITISGFNPIRREVARRSLEKLIIDGRINPTRIEETVTQCEKDIEEMIEEHGKKTILQFNLQGVKQEIISLLGKLHFRTSFSQNVLMHSIEVGVFARIIAEELGLTHPEIALRGGILHDIGKALSAEHEGPHALIGAEVAKRCGEDPLVVNAIAAHHEEIPFASVYSPVIVIADTLSASRPGARRETLSAYLRRLEKLEEIAQTFGGVKKAYALQAGREIRVIVEEDILDDDKASALARNLADRISHEMTFPGQIKVNIIREKRAVEYAR